MVKKEKNDIIEILLYLCGIFFSCFMNTSIFLYGAFLYTFIINLKKYFNEKDIYFLIKIMLACVILPNNYIVIFCITFFYLITLKKITTINIGTLLIFCFALFNIFFNNLKVLNVSFGLFYLVPIFFTFSFIKNYYQEIEKAKKDILNLLKKIVVLETIAVFFSAISLIAVLRSGVNANDWITGTFGFKQGNIFLFFVLFAFLHFKKIYDETKNKSLLIYLITTLVLAIITNSIALIIFFILSYFIVVFFKSQAIKKIKNIFLVLFMIVFFFMVTPAWIKEYLIKLTNYNYFVSHVAKFQVYQDTFVNIPKKDFKFFLIGNGIGNYSSRAAMTCTGKYVEFYNKMFSPSVSTYTSNYILNRYLKYNIERGEGTLYSPFSTIISVQGEYGILGFVLFLYVIYQLFKNSNSYSKIYVLFFLFSCFMENYLEFEKVVFLMLLLYAIDNKNIKKECV